MEPAAGPDGRYLWMRPGAQVACRQPGCRDRLIRRTSRLRSRNTYRQNRNDHLLECGEAEVRIPKRWLKTTPAPEKPV